MKRLLIIICAFVLPLATVCAGVTKQVSLTFSKSDFDFTESEDGEMIILTGKYVSCLSSDTLAPALPLITVNVAVGGSYKYNSVDYSISKSLINGNAILSNNPAPALTCSAPVPAVTGINYESKTYPDTNVKYATTNRMGDNNIISFLVCPFVYDAKSKALYLITEMTLDISLDEAEATTSGSMKKLPGLVMPSMVLNPGDMASKEEAAAIAETFEYVIVTKDSLCASFQKLADWKKQKGVTSLVVSTEDIDKKYSGSSLAVKIKKFLYEYYQDHGLKYVLLGGDDVIVPVYGCYGYVEYLCTDNTIPTDLFYACFGGDFEWNANGNDIYGELDDNVDMMPSIYVTRAPVREICHADAFVDKILSYEKEPSKNGWNDNILMSGCKLWDNNSESGKSDAEVKGDNLYNTYIAPYWNGSCKKFYDTYNDVSDQSDYILNQTNLNTELNKGYTFLNMNTHGIQAGWILPKASLYYHGHAAALKNNIPTIVVTMACLTNAFDQTEVRNYEPCLSEGFIRNKGTGVVAYLGCSRYGIGYKGGTERLGPSLMYNAEFYKRLFRSDDEDKSFGVVVAEAKAQKIASSSTYDSDRWIQFGLNPVGDPEMKIFVSTPLELPAATISRTDEGITVNTDLAGCTICIMSNADDGESYYKVKKNVSGGTFDAFNGDISVCITKQGYIPKIYTLDSTAAFIQNEAVTTDTSYHADTLLVGTNVTDTKPEGDVTISECDITLYGDAVKIYPTTKIPSGVKIKVVKE